MPAKCLTVLTFLAKEQCEDVKLVRTPTHDRPAGTFGHQRMCLVSVFMYEENHKFLHTHTCIHMYIKIPIRVIFFKQKLWYTVGVKVFEFLTPVAEYQNVTFSSS